MLGVWSGRAVYASKISLVSTLPDVFSGLATKSPNLSPSGSTTAGPVGELTKFMFPLQSNGIQITDLATNLPDVVLAIQYAYRQRLV